MVYNLRYMLHNLDSDSSKIIEAVRSTGVVVTEAMRLYVDYIVSNMKAIGTWDLCNAVYGFVGGTADSHKFNWKNPIDTDGAYRLVFSGGGTHTSFGYKGNGSNAFANTFLASNLLSVGNNSMSYYSTENTASSSGAVEMGALIGGIGDIRLSINANGITRYLSTNSTIIDGINCTLYGGIKGYTIGNISSNNITIYKNGVNLPVQSTLNSSVGGLTSMTIYINGANFNGTLLSPTHRTSGFASIGGSFTDIQAQQQSQIITNAQLILNRA